MHIVFLLFLRADFYAKLKFSHDAFFLLYTTDVRYLQKKANIFFKNFFSCFIFLQLLLVKLDEYIIPMLTILLFYARRSIHLVCYLITNLDQLGEIYNSILLHICLKYIRTLLSFFTSFPPHFHGALVWEILESGVVSYTQQKKTAE